jgi:putative membrane protein
MNRHHPLSSDVAGRQTHREIPAQHRAQEHLANERTFLAWVRTTIALIGLGFVLSRLGPWLSNNSSRLASNAAPIGIGLVCIGAVLTLLAAWRYDVVNRQIEAGLVKADRGPVWFVTIAITLISAALIVHMLAIPGAK